MKHLFLILTAALLLAACVSDRTLEEERDITESNDPMRFSGIGMDEEQQHNTRASQPLTTGFAVSAYKNYKAPGQQTVMQDYRVDYRVDGWNNNSLWEYADVQGYNEMQFLKYWDYSNYPYRFHAIAPCPERQSDFVLSDRSLNIKAPYYYQTCADGLVTTRDASQQPTAEKAEPYMISQVQRNIDGTDRDIFDGRAINTATTTRNREVWMPFHHLNSKIRFGIYSLADWATDVHLNVEDLVIKVTSPNFATTATGYAATLTTDETWKVVPGYSGFTGVTTATPPLTTQLFTFRGGSAVPGNDLHECQSQKTAYMLECVDGFMQIPQENVQMTVSLKLTANGLLYQQFDDVPVHLEDGTDHFKWYTGTLHTYYIVIGNTNDKLQIFFTATLAPWEDISGQLETDLEK